MPFILIYYLVQNLEGSKVIYKDKPTQSLPMLLNLDYVTDLDYFVIFSSTAILYFSIELMICTMKIIVMYVKHFPKGTLI